MQWSESAVVKSIYRPEVGSSSSRLVQRRLFSSSMHTLTMVAFPHIHNPATGWICKSINNWHLFITGLGQWTLFNLTGLAESCGWF